MGYKLNIYIPEEVVEDVCLTCDDTDEVKDDTGVVDPQIDEGNG